MLCARPGTSATSHSHVCLESADTKKREPRGKPVLHECRVQGKIYVSGALGLQTFTPHAPTSLYPVLVRTGAWAPWSGQVSLCQRTHEGLLTLTDGRLGSVAGVSGFLRSVKS